MTINTRIRAGGCVAAVVAIAVSGCGSAHVHPGGPARTSPASSPTATSAGDPERRASADAAALLDAFRPPPGAKPSGGKPPGAPRDLDNPMFVPNTPELVTKTRWWTVPDPPASVMSWASAHPPQGTTSAGGTSESRNGGTVSELTAMFLAPSMPAVLASRRLLVQAGPMSGGGTALRVDAQDTWLPVKPPSEAIPPASVLTIRATPPRPPSGGPTPSGPPLPTAPAVMTISDRAVIAQVAKLVGTLPVAGNGVVHCPMDTGRRLDLRFASMGGTTVATVRAASSGCGFVSVTVGGKAKPGLRGGPDLIRRLGDLLHVRWPGMN